MEHRDIFRRILEVPRLYSGFQDMLGAHAGRQRMVKMLDLVSGARVLDVGCGPADILQYFPEVEYVGIDYSPTYIETARQRFGGRAQFYVADLTTLKEHVSGKFDLVTAFGVLHHLDDATAIDLLKSARDYLKCDGQFFAIDPLIEYPQNPIARTLARLDRGKFVRTLDGYTEIAKSAFPNGAVTPRRDFLRIPYSHAVTRCRMGEVVNSKANVDTVDQ